MGKDAISNMTTATIAPTNSWKSCSAIGTLGRRRADHGQDKRPLRRSSQGEAASTTRASSSSRAGRSRCRGRRRVIRHHPGRRVRPRPALCGAMGRSDLYRRAQRGGRQGRLCGGPQRSGKGRPRSGPDAPLQPHHARLRRNQGRGRGQDGRDQQAAAGDRRAVAARGSLELRLRLQAARRATDHRRPQEHAGHSRHSRRRPRFRQTIQRARLRQLYAAALQTRSSRPEGDRDK